MRLAAALAASLAVAAPAAAAARPVTSPAPVTALAADGPLVAFAAGRSAHDCDRVRIWDRTTGRVAALGRTTACVRTSTGTGVGSLSIAGGRVLWLHHTGGNIREWSLFTATPKAPRPRRIRFVARDVDAPPPIVVGEGDSARAGGLLPYAVGREVVALRPNGSRAFSWRAPDTVTAVAARAGAVAAALADGRIVVHEIGVGSREIAGSPAATRVLVTGNGVAAQRGRTVELHADRAYRATLPAGAVLRDADGYRVVYTARGRVRLVDFLSGATRDLGPGAHAQLEGRTAVVATGRVVRALRSQ